MECESFSRQVTAAPSESCRQSHFSREVTPVEERDAQWDIDDSQLGLVHVETEGLKMPAIESSSKLPPLAFDSDSFWEWHTGNRASVQPSQVLSAALKEVPIDVDSTFGSDEFWTWHTGENLPVDPIDSDEFWTWHTGENLPIDPLDSGEFWTWHTGETHPTCGA